MEQTIEGVALVRLTPADLERLPGCGRWWMAVEDGRVMVPLDRHGDGATAMRDGAPWSTCGDHVMVDHLWLMARRRGADAAALRHAVDRVLAVARKRRT